MTEKNEHSDPSKGEALPKNTIDMSATSISEMAEMISIYYDEIKSLAKNLEEAESPLPKSDIDHLSDSLLEYSKMGNEFTTAFLKKAETFRLTKKADR